MVSAGLEDIDKLGHAQQIGAAIAAPLGRVRQAQAAIERMAQHLFVKPQRVEADPQGWAPFRGEVRQLGRQFVVADRYLENLADAPPMGCQCRW
jgi:hypothetical protein